MYNESVIADGVDLAIPMSGLGFINGVNLGVRYLLGENGGFEFSYEGLSRSRIAVGENSDESLFQEEIFYSFRQYMIGYQSINGNFGIGTSIGLNNFRVRQEISTSDFKLTFLDQNQFTARVNLSYYLKSNNTVSLAFQPYVQFPIGSFDLNELAERFNLSTSTGFNDSFFSYGLTIVFYNGRHY